MFNFIKTARNKLPGMGKDYERMMAAAQTLHGLDNQADVARLLGQYDQMLTNWKARGIPSRELLNIAKVLGGVHGQSSNRCHPGHDHPDHYRRSHCRVSGWRFWHTQVSHLDDIIEATRRKGAHEVLLGSLVGIYFKGEDAIDQVRTWARGQGLSVVFEYHPDICIFRAIRIPPK